jgi:hypothetical protein
MTFGNKTLEKQSFWELIRKAEFKKVSMDA